MPPTKQQLLLWINGWRTAAPVMQALRDEDIRRASTAAAIEMLDGSFKVALKDHNPGPFSGLVTQQLLLKRLRS